MNELAEPSVEAAPLRIGEVAQMAGVTTRTLRYWEEIGLVAPTGRRGNGERLYSVEELDRVVRIRELQDLLGFSLAEIRAVIDADAVLQRLRRAYRKGDRPDRRKRLLDEAIEGLIARLDDTIGRVTEFRSERVAKGEWMRARGIELDAETLALS